ncbi:MAG TPA: NADH-quinone oxidoreductase subunit NuoE [Candidatus Marinimicrobia bacterium]|nr:NADH-quinone oxidoreductase subunit NuoE [Candidatus Neomarinimicrobiota bacterium]
MYEPSNLIQEAVRQYGTKREHLLPILQYVRRKNRFLNEELLEEISKAMDLSAADVYGVASFYSFMDMRPLGHNIIRVCKTITCYMKGKDDIIKAIEQRLRIKLGDTTPDGRFSFLEANCIGWCHKGPAMLINDRVFTELSPEKAVMAIEEYM